MPEKKKLSRGELQDLVGKQAVKDPKYREQLLEDPKKIISKLLGQELPANVKVKAVEETADTYYVVVPHVFKEGAELADLDLERFAGGAEKILAEAPNTAIRAIGDALANSARK